MPWLKAYQHIVWPVLAAWAAYDGGWTAVVMVGTFAVCALISDRLIYWQRQNLDELQNDGPIPNGMIRVTRPGKPPVCVPLNADEADVLSRLIDVTETDDG